MASTRASGIKVFISYSHADDEWLKRLMTHLKPAFRDGHLDCWSDKRIGAGDDWRQQIRTALDEAQVAVLLVSASFYASDFIRRNELPPLLTSAQQKGIRILPVILSACRFIRDQNLACFQAANEPDRPLASLRRHEQEGKLECIAKLIEEAAHKLIEGAAHRRASFKSPSVIDKDRHYRGERTLTSNGEVGDEGEGSRPITGTIEETYENDATWIPQGTPFHTEGLASLSLDSPQHGNDPNNTWYVRARLRLGTAEHERKGRPTVYIALRDAFLSVQASGYRVINRSLIGERQPHRNFQPKVDGVEVIGPRLNGEGCLSGDPLGEDFIAQVEATSDIVEEESLTASLYSFRRSFAVSLNAVPCFNDENDPAAGEKDAVLNIIINKGLRNKDVQGRALLARDTWTRRLRS